jgi:hypothetical protein
MLNTVARLFEQGNDRGENRFGIAVERLRS